MAEPNVVYTYRGGEKLELGKKPDQLVVRALPETLAQAEAFTVDASNMVQVSSASTRVVASETELEDMMAVGRRIAPTHHAYFDTETGSDFLITDRIIVCFKDVLADSEIDAFAGNYGLTQLERYSDKDFLFQLTDHTGMNPVKLVVKLSEEDDLVELDRSKGRSEGGKQ